MTTPKTPQLHAPMDIRNTELGKAGLSWVLDNVAEVARQTRQKVGINDIMIYYWVVNEAEGRVRIVGRQREGAADVMREVYPEAVEVWSALEVAPTNPDHVTIVVVHGAAIYALVLTLEGLKNTGVLN